MIWIKLIYIAINFIKKDYLAHSGNTLDSKK